MPTFGCVRVHCPAWDSNYVNFFSADASQTPEDVCESPNLVSATKDQKIAAYPMPQGWS